MTRADELAATYGERFRPPADLRERAEQGRTFPPEPTAAGQGVVDSLGLAGSSSARLRAGDASRRTSP